MDSIDKLNLKSKCILLKIVINQNILNDNNLGKRIQSSILKELANFKTKIEILHDKDDDILWFLDNSLNLTNKIDFTNQNTLNFILSGLIRNLETIQNFDDKNFGNNVMDVDIISKTINDIINE